MSGKIWLDKDLQTQLRFKRVVRKVCDVEASRRRHAGDSAPVSYELGETMLVGALSKLWIHADTHIRADNSLEATIEEIDELVGIAGFCKVLPADWFVVLDPDRIELPDFLEHNGTVAKKNASHANRQARYRERQKAASHDDVGASRVTPERDAIASPSHPIPSHPKPPDKRARATRLPDDFLLSLERRAIAEAECLDPFRTFSKFQDHWRAASGAKARKHDWEAAWRTWCRNEADWNRKSPEADAAARRQRQTDASWNRVNSHCNAIGCPLKPYEHDTPETFETRVKNWEVSSPRAPGGPTPITKLLAGKA